MAETQDWQEEAVRLRREEKMATAEIAARVDRSASQVRRVIAAANAARHVGAAEAASNGNGHQRDYEVVVNGEVVGHGAGGMANALGAMVGQTTVDDFTPPDRILWTGENGDDVAKFLGLDMAPGAFPTARKIALPNGLDDDGEVLVHVTAHPGDWICRSGEGTYEIEISGRYAEPEDDPAHPDTLAAFRGEAGEAVGPMPPIEPEDTEPYVETRLKGTMQLALNFGDNADEPVGGVLKLKSDSLASGFYGLGDIITGTFTARIVDVVGKERYQRASEEFRVQPQGHVALITEVSLK